MHPATIELMHEQVRTIYRAVTGAELSEDADIPATDEASSSETDVERRFAELETLVRQNGALGERVPPFSFTPLVDIVDTGTGLIVEVAAPGVELDEVDVVVTDHELTVAGVRRGERSGAGRMYLHAEIPRGPFNRTIQLPCAVDARVRVDAQDGVILIGLHKI